MYRTDFWTLWERARVGCFKRTASKHVYYPGWNRSPAQVGCIRQVLGPGALGRPRGIGWRGRWEGGSGWEIHVKPWLILVNVWQKPLQYCKVISLQLIKKKKKSDSSKIPQISLSREPDTQDGPPDFLIHSPPFLNFPQKQVFFIYSVVQTGEGGLGEWRVFYFFN